jgi:hypothetical protein
MLVAIDFDGVFTADPELLRIWVAALRARGHQGVLVTGRGDHGTWGDEVRAAVGDLLPIVFADGGWKRSAAARAGYLPQIWIDDQPEYVGPQLDPAVVAFKQRREP